MKPITQIALLALASIVSFFISAAPVPDAPLKLKWYKTSIIIFTRPEINNENTAEMLFIDAQRNYPGNTRAFPFDANQIEYYNPLSLRTSLALTWPTLAMLDPVLNQVPPDVPVDPEWPTLLDRVDVPVNSAVQPIDPLIIEELPEEIAQAILANDLELGPQPRELQPEEAQSEEPSGMELALEAFIDYEIELKNQSLIPLPEDEHLLKKELTRLQSRDDYRVLYTATWNQAIPARNNPAPILVQAGARRFGLFELEGTIAITLGRYLHVNAELWLHKLPDRLERAEMAQDIQWMQMSESRRMRSTEIHYLDHPKFGVLIRIDPVEIPHQLNELWHEAHLGENSTVPGSNN